MLFEEEEDSIAEDISQVEYVQPVSLVIMWWIKKRLKVSEDIQDLRTFVLRNHPVKNDFVRMKNGIAHYIYTVMPAEQKQKLKYCMDFIHESLTQPALPADVNRCIRTRDRILKHINKMYLQLLKDIYQVEPCKSEHIDFTQFDLISPVSLDNPVSFLEDAISSLTLTENVVSVNPDAISSLTLTENVVSVNPDAISSLTLTENVVSVNQDVRQDIIDLTFEPTTSSLPSSSSSSLPNPPPVEDAECCCICLDSFNEIGDDVCFCHEFGHPIHLLCRVALAERKKHNCPSCRQLFEKDGGEEFCEMYGIEFKTRKGRKSAVKPSNSSSSSSSSFTTPRMTTRSSSVDAMESVERREYVKVRNHMIQLLQNKRIPVDILQECLAKILPFENTTSTHR